MGASVFIIIINNNNNVFSAIAQGPKYYYATRRVKKDIHFKRSNTQKSLIFFCFVNIL